MKKRKVFEFKNFSCIAAFWKGKYQGVARLQNEEVFRVIGIDLQDVENYREIGITLSANKNHRTAHCFRCKNKLDNHYNHECDACEWILCVCGACGCSYMKY